MVILKDRDFYCFCKSVLYKSAEESKKNLKLFYIHFFFYNDTVPAYINDMFRPSSACINTESKLVMGIPLERTNAKKEHLFLVGPKKWKNTQPSLKITYALKKEIVDNLSKSIMTLLYSISSI